MKPRQWLDPESTGEGGGESWNLGAGWIPPVNGSLWFTADVGQLPFNPETIRVTWGPFLEGNKSMIQNGVGFMRSWAVGVWLMPEAIQADPRWAAAVSVMCGGRVNQARFDVTTVFASHVLAVHWLQGQGDRIILKLFSFWLWTVFFS